MSEIDEAAQLPQLAVITAAEDDAEAEVPGDVVKTELDSENGSVGYSVEIGTIDVKVDADSGTVLDQQSDNDDE